MPATVIRGRQVLDGTIQRADLDTATAGQAVAAKLVQGAGISLNSTGADSGTGDVTVSAPVATATTAGLVPTPPNSTTTYLRGDATFATLATDIQPTIWSVRQRSWNSVGNSSFECDQRNIGTALTNPANGTFIQDRWIVQKSALTGAVNTALQDVSTAPIVIPGINFGITSKYQRFTVGTAQASLATGDYYLLRQNIEGPRWRELALDVHSCSLLVRSSIASLVFSISLQDNTFAHSLVKQCTLGAANTWTLVTLPNLPVWSGTFSTAPGQVGYLFSIVLAAGATLTAAANNAWQTANILGVTGNSNFLATLSATFDIAFVQHEPGPLCSTLIDYPFTQAYDDALRYYCKSYDYGTAIGTITNNGIVPLTDVAGAFLGPIRWPKPMAKTPTLVNTYSHDTGALNSLWDSNTATHRAVTGIIGLGSTGMAGLTATGVVAGTGFYGYSHYIADTGW